jgi:MFS family permease
MERHYGWVIVAVGALMTCFGMGALFSLPVFQSPISEATGWSRTGIGGTMTIAFLVMGVAGFAWGAVSDRFGARIALVIGNLLLGLGLVMASRSESLVEFQVWYGAVIGVAGGAFFPPLIATTTGWFDKHRGLAVSLVTVGIGVAPLTVTPFAGWLIEAYGWREAQFMIGVAVWVLLVPLSFLIRKPPVLADEPAVFGDGPAPAPAGIGGVGKALRSPQFIVLALVFFACCACHSGPIFHTISYAMICGIAPMAAATIYGMEGLAGLGGRIFFGVAADRFGVKPVIVVGLLIQAVAAGAYLYASNLETFYAVALVFGLAYGGVMPLYAVLAREYFGPHIMGTVFGAATMVSALGMALGPGLGGWIFDTFGTYTWLYVGSAAIGLGAAAIALAFPPVRPRLVPQPHPAE